MSRFWNCRNGKQMVSFSISNRHRAATAFSLYLATFSHAQTTWASRQNPSNGVALHAITWTGSQLVVVGSNGMVLTSSNGENWADQSTGNPVHDLRCVIRVGSLLIAMGGDYGPILSSSNEPNWIQRDSGNAWYLSGAAWSGSQVVAVGWSGTVLTSPNGITWTPRNSGTISSLHSVTWAKDQFVAVGNAGTILSSSDGAKWSQRSSGITSPLRSVVWGAGQIVAMGNSGAIVTSSDGLNWTNRSMGRKNVSAIAWTGNQFVALGSPILSRTGGDSILISSNGVDWRYVLAYGTSGGINSLTWTGNQFVAVGGAGGIYTSTQDPVAIRSGNISLGGDKFFPSHMNGMGVDHAQNGNHRIQIIDLLGRKGYESRIEDRKSIAIRDFASSARFIRITSPDGARVQRIISP